MVSGGDGALVAGLLGEVDRALAAGRLAAEAAKHLRHWLEAEEYAEFRDEIQGLIERGEFEKLNDAFGQVLPFGTAGRRGPVGAGPNRINARTIGDSAQGLVNYLARLHPGEPKSAVIAFDTRHHSLQFARSIAEVFAAGGIRAYLFDGPRPTPELSMSVCELETTVGVMVSASHNPPGDNGIKVYWDHGGQVLPPHDAEIIRESMQVTTIDRMPLAEAEAQGLVTTVGMELDEKYRAAVLAEALLEHPKGERPRAKVVFTPLHGVGVQSVVPVLEGIGYELGRDLLPVPEQWEPDPDFRGTPNQIPNPEAPEALELATQLAQRTDADVVLATDPDADRLGAVVPTTPEKQEWVRLMGGLMGAVLLDFVAGERARRGDLPAGAIATTTLVTPNLVNDVGEAYGITVKRDLAVGFKWIAEVIRDLEDPADFVFGAEQSYGYLKGTHCKDKDGAVAALLFAELTNKLKAEGRTPYEYLWELFARHGYYTEHNVTMSVPGAEGRQKTERIMQELRGNPPREIAGVEVIESWDYRERQAVDIRTGDTVATWERPLTDLVILELAHDEKSWLAVRPSGTEPKIRFYINLHVPVPPDDPEALRAAQRVADRLAEEMDKEARAWAEEAAES